MIFRLKKIESYGINQEQKKLISAFTTMATRKLLGWVKGL